MNQDLKAARDDLAFMRGLVSDSGNFQAAAGEVFLWAGLIYGAQCVGHFLASVGALHLTPPGYLALGFGPTLVFLVFLGFVIWKRRGEKEGGAASRAINAAFMGAGLANLVLIGVFAYGAYRLESFAVWLYHPTVVCLFQGVAWFVVWSVRKRAWLGVVSLGWFATTLICGLLVDQPGYFVLVLGIGLILCMALPGYVMLRLSKPA